MGGWSFAVDMTKPKYETTEVENFPMSKVYQHLDMVINELKIPGMKIDNCLFTHGSDIKNEKWILSDKFAKPNQCTDDFIVKAYMEKNDPKVRFYKWIQVYDWGNELVVSYLIRFTKQNKKLFVEVNTFLLTPLIESYRSVDSLIYTKAKGNFSLFLLSILSIPIAIGQLLNSPFLVIKNTDNLKVSSLYCMVKERRRAAPPPPQTSPARGPAPLTPSYHAFLRGYI